MWLKVDKHIPENTSSVFFPTIADSMTIVPTGKHTVNVVTGTMTNMNHIVSQRNISKQSCGIS